MDNLYKIPKSVTEKWDDLLFETVNEDTLCGFLIEALETSGVGDLIVLYGHYLCTGDAVHFIFTIIDDEDEWMTVQRAIVPQQVPGA